MQRSLSTGNLAVSRMPTNEQSVQQYQGATGTIVQQDIRTDTGNPIIINAYDSSVSFPPASQPNDDTYSEAFKNILYATKLRIRNINWRKFVTTLAFTEAQKLLQAFGVVVIIGRPGDGKTTLGLNLLRESNRKKVILTNPHDWYVLQVRKEKITVLVDNIFGYDQIDSSLKEQWLHLFDMIWSQIIHGRVSLILLFKADIYYMCREQLSRFEIFNKPHLVLLTKSKYQLSRDQMMKIAKAHMQRTRCKIEDNELQDVVSNLTCLPFPRVCQIFENCQMAQNRGIEYFRNPIECLRKEVSIIKEQNTIQYFLLALLVLLKGQLPKWFFCHPEDALPIMKQMHKFVPLRPENGDISFESVANGMVGTYLTYPADGIYRFLHPVIYDSVLLSFSEFHLKDIIDICPVRFLVQYTRIPSCRHMEGTLAVQVLLGDCGMLAKRIAVELIEGDFDVILSHPALEDTGFVNILTQNILKKDGCKEIGRRKIGFFHVYKSGPFSFASKYDPTVFLAPEFISSSLFEDSVEWICNYKTLLCLIVLRDLYCLSEMIISSLPSTFFDLRLLRCCCLMGHLGAVQKLLPKLLHNVGNYSCFAVFRDLLKPCILSKRENKQLLSKLLKWWKETFGYQRYWYSCCSVSFSSWIALKNCKGLDRFKYDILEDSCRLALALGKVKYLEALLRFLTRKENYVSFLNDLLHQLLVQFHYQLNNREPKVEISSGVVTDTIRLLQRNGATGYPEKMIFMAAQHQTSEALQVLLGTSSSVNYALGSESTATRRMTFSQIFQDSLDAVYSVKGRTPLLEASFRSLDSVKLLLEHGADVDAVDERGYTVLHSPLVYSDVNILQKILSRKATPIRPNISNQTPLHVACEHGSFQCFFLLLSKYDSVNYTVDGSTALHVALLSASDKCQKVEALLQSGANVKAVDKNGNTPLHLAAVGKRVNIVSKLIELGAEVNKKNKEGNTPLHIALSPPSTKESVDTLLDNGADVWILNNDDVTPVHLAFCLTSASILEKLLIRCPKNPSDLSIPTVPNSIRSDPFECLIDFLDLEKVKLFLRYGFCETEEDAQNWLIDLANADFPSIMETYPVFDHEIHSSYNYFSSYQTFRETNLDSLFEEIVNFLCDKGADVNKQTPDGNTPLQTAMLSSNTKMVEFLLKKGTDPNTDFTAGENIFVSFLHILENEQYLKPFHKCQLLFDHGWKPKVEGNNNSGLPFIAGFGYWKSLKMLLECGGNDVNARNENGESALHVCRSWRCLNVLLEHNANVDIQDQNGRTPLHLLVKTHTNKKSIMLLLQKKANPNIFDQNGDTPLLVACKNSSVLRKSKTEICHEKVTKHNVDQKTFTVNETKKQRKAPRDKHRRGHDNVKVLLANRADSNVKDRLGDTAAHIAVKQKNCELLNVLLCGGCSSNVRDANGNTPLNLLLRSNMMEQHYSGVKESNTNDVVKEDPDLISSLTKPVTLGNTKLWKMVKELVQHDADPDTRNQYGDAPLHYAVVTDCLRTVELLLQAGADPDVQDWNSRTPLHRVAQCGHTRTARVLLDSGCDVDRTDNVGNTALHFAVWGMKYGLVKLLIEKGADLTKMNDRGETAFEACLNLEHASKPCWWTHKGEKILTILDPEKKEENINAATNKTNMTDTVETQMKFQISTLINRIVCQLLVVVVILLLVLSVVVE